jgi:hypothetical protein
MEIALPLRYRHCYSTSRKRYLPCSVIFPAPVEIGIGKCEQGMTIQLSILLRRTNIRPGPPVPPMLARVP